MTTFLSVIIQASDAVETAEVRSDAIAARRAIALAVQARDMATTTGQRVTACRYIRRAEDALYGDE